MKKLLVCLLILLLAGSAFAETQTRHDMSIFESMQNYAYDKFDKEWNCHGAYQKIYSDAKLVVGLQVDGNDNGPTFLPHLYAWIRKPDNTAALYNVNSIDILVGETLYSYPKWQLGEALSYVFLGEKNGKALVEAMAEADEISVRLNHSLGNVSIDITPEEYSTTLKPMARALVDFDIWSYIDSPDTANWENAYPLEIS